MKKLRLKKVLLSTLVLGLSAIALITAAAFYRNRFKTQEYSFVVGAQSKAELKYKIPANYPLDISLEVPRLKSGEDRFCSMQASQRPVEVGYWVKEGFTFLSGGQKSLEVSAWSADSCTLLIDSIAPQKSGDQEVLVMLNNPPKELLGRTVKVSVGRSQYLGNPDQEIFWAWVTAGITLFLVLPSLLGLLSQFLLSRSFRFPRGSYFRA